LGISSIEQLPQTLVQAYKLEYETTPDLTIDELCQKHDIVKEQLPDYKQWKKQVDIISGELTQEVVVSENPKILDDIERFKQLAVQRAVEFIEQDARFAEVKEFKDIVAIVDTIEKSYKNKTTNEPTINILIQNLVKKFNDDC